MNTLLAALRRMFAPKRAVIGARYELPPSADPFDTTLRQCTVTERRGEWLRLACVNYKHGRPIEYELTEQECWFLLRWKKLAEPGG